MTAPVPLADAAPAPLQARYEGWRGVSEPVEDADLRVLSLGAGVQSTTLALMAAHREIGPMPDAAIFADTGWEPRAVYEHLDWLSGGNVLPFPIVRVQGVNLRDQVIERATRSHGRFITVPYFLQSGGMGRRQCTGDAKIEPIHQAVRALLGVPKGARATRYRVEQWIGISRDELVRMKAARVPWITHRWPLIERRMTRHDCLAWLARHEYPEPPRSACIGCPFHRDSYWRRLQREDPEAFDDAVAVDHAMRAGGPIRGMRQLEYMHRSCRPLDQVDFRTEAERGQLSFLDECDGVCGT